MHFGLTRGARDDQLTLYLLLDPAGILYLLLCSSVYRTGSQYKARSRNIERPVVATCINQSICQICSPLFIQKVK